MFQIHLEFIFWIDLIMYTRSVCKHYARAPSHIWLMTRRTGLFTQTVVFKIQESQKEARNSQHTVLQSISHVNNHWISLNHRQWPRSGHLSWYWYSVTDTHRMFSSFIRTIAPSWKLWSAALTVLDRPLLDASPLQVAAASALLFSWCIVKNWICFRAVSANLHHHVGPVKGSN